MRPSDTLFAHGGGVLLVTFNGEETPMTGRICFGLGKDGRAWEALNDARQGSHPGMPAKRAFRMVRMKPGHIDNLDEFTEVRYDGSEITLQASRP